MQGRATQAATTRAAAEDRIGRRPIYMTACTAATLFAFPMSLRTNFARPALVVTVVTV
ncbi:hypothetical protein [Streptomyces venetus]|uniref:hypothetical protein n=1 Tax=Streptomyces venetus TaxID=1701086 RepID=UPI003C2C0C28